jgi:hypothetical protein
MSFHIVRRPWSIILYLFLYGHKLELRPPISDKIFTRLNSLVDCDNQK